MQKLRQIREEKKKRPKIRHRSVMLSALQILTTLLHQGIQGSGRERLVSG